MLYITINVITNTQIVKFACVRYPWTLHFLFILVFNLLGSFGHLSYSVGSFYTFVRVFPISSSLAWTVFLKVLSAVVIIGKSLRKHFKSDWVTQLKLVCSFHFLPLNETISIYISSFSQIGLVSVYRSPHPRHWMKFCKYSNYT